MGCRVQGFVQDFEFRVSGFGVWVSGFGCRASGLGHRVGKQARLHALVEGLPCFRGWGLAACLVSGSCYRVPLFSFTFSVFWFVVSGFGFVVSGFELSSFDSSGFRAYGFRLTSVFGSGFGSWFRISGLAASLKSGFRVAGSGSRFGASASLTSDSGFQVPGVRFRVSGVGKRRTRREGEPPRSGWESGCQVSG